VHHLVICVATQAQKRVVRFPQVALEVHNAFKNDRLVEEGFEFGGGSQLVTQERRLPIGEPLDFCHVAIGFEHTSFRSRELTSANSTGNLVCKREWLLRPIASSGANPSPRLGQTRKVAQLRHSRIRSIRRAATQASVHRTM
jgi:hypothetical protein